MDIKSKLKKLGFQDKETQIYLTILKAGKIKPSELSKKTGINRATVYNICDSLKSKGVIDEDATSKTSSFYPLSTSTLSKMFDEEKNQIKEKMLLAKTAADQLDFLNTSKEYPVPKLRFIEHKGIESFLKNNLDKWQKSAAEYDNTWWGIQDHSFIKNFQSYVEWYWLSGKNKDFKINFIGNNSKEEQYMRSFNKINRNIPFANDMDYSLSISVSGDYVLMIQSREQPFYLFEIHDKAIANNMRAIFKKLWKEYKKK